MSLTKQQLEDLKAEYLLCCHMPVYIGVIEWLNKLIEEAPERHWKFYGKFKPENEGDYLVRLPGYFEVFTWTGERFDDFRDPQVLVWQELPKYVGGE